MEKSEIIALIEALCERPLEDHQVEPPVELQAFCREAAKALSQADASGRRGPGTIGDVDRYTAALATLLSGSDAEAAHRTVAEATLRSATARLDAESALAFVDAIEQSSQTAPPHLVEEMIAGDRTARTGLALQEGAGISALWPRIAGGSWSVRPWRMAAACAVVLVAGVASWSAFWLQTDPTVGGSAVPMAKTTSESRSVADVPAPPRPSIATTQPCEPRDQASEAPNAEISPPAGVPKANKSAGTDCAPTRGHQFADRPADENEAIAARQQAEAARQAASARASSKVGATQADPEPGQGPVRADRSGPMFGSRPAATLSAPAAARPAAPAGMK
ncbi:MAG: hypothetical protein E7813_16365 [Bradyrhizobium sp.]|uniref:hypothetical protein n=1 Tax=Bradyrhizobium sp. TaxID=376 RepID=UPI001204435D|nr:hypothetical protein [Bradyrhizobium sp.]THD64850.1 MAG: hypothetical protein E7813_16365 [Bradyrhizobium sp.]